MSIDEDIINICSILEGSFDPITDRQLLLNAFDQQKGLAAVINAFYELGPDQFRARYTLYKPNQGWDETQFAADRDGGVADNPSNSFNIVVDDERAVINGIRPSAPSPPPSRARSPLTAATDMTAGKSIGGPVSRDQEDSDLNAAIAASLQSHDGVYDHRHGMQESGVTPADNSNTSKPAFGPANRSEYDPSQWAMTVLNKPSEVSPASRKRAGDAPVLLMSNDKRWPAATLGPMLTVLHAIPMARNAFLAAEPRAADYGSNKEWWKGGTIDTKKDDGLTTWTERGHTAGVDFIEEMHRLMAFLELSDRSYATADSLTEARNAVQGAWNQLQPEEFALQTLATLHDKNEAKIDLSPFEHLDELRAYKDESSSIPAEQSQRRVPRICLDRVEVEQPRLFLPLNVPAEAFATGQVRSLYDALRLKFWSAVGEDPGVTADTDLLMGVLTQIPEILILRIGEKGIQGSFDIPEDLYMDRHDVANEDRASKLSCHIRKVNIAIAKARKNADAILQGPSFPLRPIVEGTGQPARDVELDGMNWVSDATAANSSSAAGEVMSSQKTRIQLSEDVIRLLKRDMALIKGNAFWRLVESGSGYHPRGLQMTQDNIDAVNEDDDLTHEEKSIMANCRALIKAQERNIARVQEQLQELEGRIAACQKLLTAMAGRMTVPCEADGWNPQLVYHLRGVCIGPSHVFMCRRAHLESETSEDAIQPEDQWWELAVDMDSDEPVTAKKSTVEAALRAATAINAQPLLVYASSKALDEDPMQLPDALKRFVKMDNRIFKQELIESNASPQSAKRTLMSPPVSPSKRQQRSSRANSFDSMATNKASLGSFSERDSSELLDADDGLPDYQTAYGVPGGGRSDYRFGGSHLEETVRNGAEEEEFLEERKPLLENTPMDREVRNESVQGSPLLGSEMVQLNINHNELHTESEEVDAIATWDHPDPSDDRARAMREASRSPMRHATP